MTMPFEGIAKIEALGYQPHGRIWRAATDLRYDGRRRRNKRDLELYPKNDARRASPHV
jgi:hypothetical protein